MGKWAVPCGAIYFRQVVVLAGVPGFFNDRLLANSSVEYSEMTFFEGAGMGKIKTRIERSNFRRFSADFRVLGPPSKNSKCHNSINIVS